MIEEPSGHELAASTLQFLKAAKSESARINRAITTYTLTMAAWAIGRQARTWWRGRYQYSVNVRSREDIYDDVIQKLMEMIPERNKRALLAAAYRDGRRLVTNDWEDSTFQRAYRPTLRLGTQYDGDTSQTFTLEGHKVAVLIEREPIDLGAGSSEVVYRGERLRFTTHTEAGRDAVTRWLATILAERDVAEAPRFFMLSRYGGGWERRNDLPMRTLDSIVLRAGLAEEIAADVENFLGDRDEYTTRGWPYHRGYLFYGPGGTGKSSLAQALAGHFGLDIYLAPLGDMEKDTNMLHVFSQVQPNSVLLLEDVDVYHATRNRDDAGEGVSLSGLLNALDGVSTPSGIITILTTNHPEVLDEALTRKGRVDRKYEIGYLDNEQLERLMVSLIGEAVDVGTITEDDHVSPVDVIEEMKPYLKKPASGIQPIRAMLDEKRPLRRRGHDE